MHAHAVATDNRQVEVVEGCTLEVPMPLEQVEGYGRLIYGTVGLEQARELYPDMVGHVRFCPACKAVVFQFQDFPLGAI